MVQSKYFDLIYLNGLLNNLKLYINFILTDFKFRLTILLLRDSNNTYIFAV